MLLLAEAGTFSWVAPVMTTLAAVVAGYFARQSQRDKLAFDADLAQLKADHARTKKKLARAGKKLAAMGEAITACHAERDTLREEVASLRATCDRQQREIDELRKTSVNNHNG